MTPQPTISIMNKRTATCYFKTLVNQAGGAMLKVSKKVRALRNMNRLTRYLVWDARALPWLAVSLWVTGRLVLSRGLFAWNEVSWYLVCSYLAFPWAADRVQRWQREVATKSDKRAKASGSRTVRYAIKVVLVFLAAPLLVIGNLLVPESRK